MIWKQNPHTKMEINKNDLIYEIYDIRVEYWTIVILQVVPYAS